MIDLDRPGPAPVEPEAERRLSRPWTLRVGLLVLGALLGGILVHQWQVQQWQQARDSVASIVVLPDASAWPDDSVQTSVSVGGQVTTVSLATHTTIVNTGPVAVQILTLSGQQPGLSLQGLGGLKQVGPGATLPAAVEIQVDCAASRRLLAVPVTLTVETRSGARSEVPAKIGGDLWVRQVETLCAGPAPRPGRVN